MLCLLLRIRLFLCLELGARGLLTETGVICIIYLLPTGVFGSEGGGSRALEMREQSTKGNLQVSRALFGF